MGPGERSLAGLSFPRSQAMVREAAPKSDIPRRRKKIIIGMSELASMTRIVMSEPYPEGDVSRLSRDEIENAIKSLTAAEQTAIMKIAMQYANLTPYGADDLVQEALARTLEGRRAWPRGLPATRFFKWVIRSIVSKEWKRKDVLLDEEVEDIPDGEEQRALGPNPSSAAPPQGWPEERAILDKNYIIEIIKALDDDPIAQKILRGMLDGAEGDELQKISGLSQTEYESKRRKIRRRGDKIRMERKK